MLKLIGDTYCVLHGPGRALWTDCKAVTPGNDNRRLAVIPA